MILEKSNSSKFVYEKWAAKHALDPNATRKEKELWWGRETNEHWIEGKFGLTGAHYFFLTQAIIKDATGRRMRPQWRDLDDLIYGSYENARKTFWDLMVTKRILDRAVTCTWGDWIQKPEPYPDWTQRLSPGTR